MVSAQTAERPGYIKNCPSCTGGGSSGGGGGGNNCTGQGSTLYVDGTNGISTNSGRTWATAVTTLQRAIDIADECEAVTTILVAKGTYTASTTSGTLAARDFSFVVGYKLTIQGGYPTGGGVRNFIDNPTILDGEIQDGYEAYHVMVIYGSTETVEIDGFQIRNGFAEGTGTVQLKAGVDMPRDIGAALYIRDATSVIVSNCVFYTNVAINKGGAILAYNSNLTLRNCVFENNTTGNAGSVIYAQNNSTIYLNYCTLNNNLSYNGGAVVHAEYASTINTTNTIIWGSSASLGGGGTRNTSYSLLQNGNMNDNCISDNPQFKNPADPNGADNKWFTADDGLALLDCSPAINRADNSIYGGMYRDVTNSPRPFNEQSDIGAYEKQQIPEITSSSQLSLNNDSTDTYFYNGTTALTAKNNCRIIARLSPLNDEGSVGRIRAKTYIDASNLSFQGVPLVNRHYNINDFLAAPNGKNTVTLYFSNTDFTTYNARPEVIGKLPLTAATNPERDIRIVHFRSNSLSGVPESYTASPVYITPFAVTWLSGAATWRVMFEAEEGLGGFFLTAVKQFEFTGNGNWSVAANWLNNEIPPSTLESHYKIVIRENTVCTLDVPQHLKANAVLLAMAAAVFTVNNNLTVDDNMTIAKNKKIFTFIESFIVPAGVTKINAALWGAGGYGGGSDAGGGNAGFLAAEIDVTPGEEFTISVAQSTNSNINARYSSVVRSNGEILLVAAGGGNGGGNSGKGGHGGAIGENGSISFAGSGGAGKGASATAGGLGGAAGLGSGATAGTNGGILEGGVCSVNSGGSGGRGYYGGGGSGTYFVVFTGLKPSGGGGGGSNYASAGITTSHNTYVGGIVPANPLYNGGGLGGTGTGPGSAGKVVLTW